MRGGPLGGEDSRGLVAAAQVLGLGFLAEPAEVDDPLDAFAPRHAGEVAGARALALGEAAAAGHRVDEVVGDLDSPRRTLEAAGVADVADVELVAGPLQTGCPRAIADQAADRRVRAPRAPPRAGRRRSRLRPRSGCSARLPDATRRRRSAVLAGAPRLRSLTGECPPPRAKPAGRDSDRARLRLLCRHPQPRADDAALAAFPADRRGPGDDGGGRPARLHAEAARGADPLDDPDRDLETRRPASSTLSSRAPTRSGSTRTSSRTTARAGP